MASNEVKYVPFSELNALVVQKLNDHSVYTIGSISFLKIFEHALTYAALKNNKKLIANHLRKPLWYQQLRARLKYWKNAGPNRQTPLKRIVFIDPVRLTTDAEGQKRSIYMDRIINEIPRQQSSIIQKKRQPEVVSDYTLSDFARVYPKMYDQEKMVLQSLQTAYSNATKAGSFTAYELEHIESALFIFWEDFRFYFQMFHGQPVEQVVFICHYHNEGMLAACRLLEIKTVELQHGLIAANDLYYVYDQQFAAIMPLALFPDQLWVYGPYWKRVVERGCEFQPSQVQVAGDYLSRKPATAVARLEKENMILVCAQKLMHEDYLAYLERLARYVAEYPDWRVVVKMHPLEPRKELYQAIRQWGFELVDMEYTLDELLQRARIQISIYSTTFFDAIGFDVVNYALQNYGNYQDYAADIIKESVAFPLTIDQNPITLYLENKETHYAMERTEIYSPMDAALICGLLAKGR
jgi:hypothetical protein